MRPGQIERRSHDYQRHGTTSLFAALDIATGRVIGRCYQRHRAVEFRRFLATVEQAVPADLDIHLVLDSLKRATSCRNSERHDLGMTGRHRRNQHVKARNITWDEQTLDKFLENPPSGVHGTKMVIRIPDAEDRHDIR
jgi:hypothetical protein